MYLVYLPLAFLASTAGPGPTRVYTYPASLQVNQIRDVCLFVEGCGDNTLIIFYLLAKNLFLTQF